MAARWVNLLAGAAAVTASTFATTDGLGTPVNIDGASGIGYYLDESGVPRALGGGALLGFPTRVALAAAPTSLLHAYLTEAGREGTFVWSGLNLKSQCDADIEQGLYVPPTGGDGTTGAWVRIYNGGAEFDWFGSVADMTANGVGTDNTPVFNAARAALIAANKSWLHIRQHAAAYRFSTAPSAIHDGIFLTGERHYSNPGTVGAVTYVGIQVYRGTVLGFAPDTPGFKLVASTDHASNAIAFQYQSSTGSAIRDLIMYSEGGTGTTSHGIETFVKTDLDNLRIIGFAGSGVKLSGDDSGTVNQYGNPINSHIRNVYAMSNKLHGFHITGNNGNVIKLDDCFAQLNGGVGYLDQGFLGNGSINCVAATNNASFGTPAGFSAAQRAQVLADYAGLATALSGSFVCLGGSATSSYTACYAEVGFGQYPDLSSQCVVNGGQLSNVVWQFNVGTSGNPTTNSGRGVDTPQLNFTRGQNNTAVAFGNAKIYRHADLGLVLQGAPNAIGTYDITARNLNDQSVFAVPTGTQNVQFFNNINLIGNIVSASLSGDFSTSGFFVANATRGYRFVDAGGALYLQAGPLSGAAGQINITAIFGGANCDVLVTGNVSASVAFQISGTKVVGARKTGWATATGTATRTTFDTTTVTLPQLAERLKALIDDLHASAGHGLIGT